MVFARLAELRLLNTDRRLLTQSWWPRFDGMRLTETTIARSRNKTSRPSHTGGALLRLGCGAGVLCACAAALISATNAALTQPRQRFIESMGRTRRITRSIRGCRTA